MKITEAQENVWDITKEIEKVAQNIRMNIDESAKSGKPFERLDELVNGLSEALTDRLYEIDAQKPKRKAVAAS